LFKTRRSEKGISPILATLLLIVIAVAAVIVTYAWVLTFTTTQTQQAGAVLVKENVRFYSVGTTKNRTEITIRNTGSASGKIVAVYWSDSSFKELAALDSSEYTLNPSTGVVNAGSSITITIKWGVSGGTISLSQWVSGSTYYFKVATDTGAFLEFSEKAP
jgi:flagellin-like protein